jgi:hypothetical protein
MRDACKAAAKFGACDESEWPYNDDLLSKEPPRTLYDTASGTSCEYSAVTQSLKGLLCCLMHEQPILVGMSVYANIHKVGPDGVLRMPGKDDEYLGGHAILVCGYDILTSRFKAQNCWGVTWGNKGYFELPFEYVLNPALCWDFWALHVKTKK